MVIRRTTDNYTRDGSAGRVRDSNVYVGIVKEVVDDAQRMGRLAVYIPELSTNPEDSNQWIIVSYASPFAGASNFKNVQANSQTMDGSQTSYGWWAIPPDVNNEVLVCFANGDIGRGYWFACLYQQNMNHMVPGLASNVPTDPATKDGTGALPAVVEYNKANVTSTTNPQRPVFTPLTDGLKGIGLTTDPERGHSNTSARREAPSAAFGFLSPRGNTFHIDDNTDNEFIRLRTRSGVGIVIHETTGYVYINSKGGNWIEVSDAGVDIYSAAGINLRSVGDMNIRADGDINFDAGGSINMKASSMFTIQSGKSIDIGAGTDLVLAALGKVTSTSGADTLIFSGGALRTQSSSETSSLAGTKWTRSAPSILDDSSSAPSVPQNQAFVPQQKALIDNKSSGSPTTVQTIVSRMPSREPWSGHPKSDHKYPINNGATSTVQTGDGKTATVKNPPMTQCPTGTGSKMSNSQYAAMKQASDRSGIPLPDLLAIGDIESANWTGYLTATHSAQGIMQIEPGTWNDLVNKYGSTYNITQGQINNDEANATMGALYLKDQQQTLTNKYGSSVGGDYGLVYASYNLGAGNFAKLMNAPDDAIGMNVIGKAAANNPQFFKTNNQLLTVAQVKQKYHDSVYGKANAYADQYNLGPPCDRTGGTPGTTSATSNATSNGKSSVATNAQQYIGQSVGSGQCVALVQAATGLPNTKYWQQGAQVQGNTDLQAGTAIAVFDSNGTYGNHTDGSSHAAIYLGQDSNGIQVIDQWSGQPAHVRTIAFKSTGTAVNQGQSYSVIATGSQ